MRGDASLGHPESDSRPRTQMVNPAPAHIEAIRYPYAFQTESRCEFPSDFR